MWGESHVSVTEKMSKDLLYNSDWRCDSLLFRLRAFHNPRWSHLSDEQEVEEPGVGEADRSDKGGAGEGETSGASSEELL